MKIAVLKEDKKLSKEEIKKITEKFEPNGDIIITRIKKDYEVDQDGNVKEVRKKEEINLTKKLREEKNLIQEENLLAKLNALRNK